MKKEYVDEPSLEFETTKTEAKAFMIIDHILVDTDGMDADELDEVINEVMRTLDQAAREESWDELRQRVDQFKNLLTPSDTPIQ